VFFPQDDLKLVHVGFADIRHRGAIPHLERFRSDGNHVIETETLRFKEFRACSRRPRMLGSLAVGASLCENLDHRFALSDQRKCPIFSARCSPSIALCQYSTPGSRATA